MKRRVSWTSGSTLAVFACEMHGQKCTAHQLVRARTVGRQTSRDIGQNLQKKRASSLLHESPTRFAWRANAAQVFGHVGFAFLHGQCECSFTIAARQIVR